MKKNLFYSFLYEVVIALYPLLLIPYLAHTIGKTGTGIYSYTYSAVGFFLLVCQLGVNTCGTRAIAQTRDDRSKMTATFKAIFTIQGMASLLALVAFFVYLGIWGQQYRLYYILLIPFIIGQGIRISWFFLGIENIATILLRNVMIRIVSAVLILLFVRTQESLPFYFIIMSGSYLLGDISVWPKALKRLDKTKLDMALVKQYVKPMFLMFLPILALRGAFYVDELMLGTMEHTDDVAIYDNVYKIVNMPLQLYTVFSNVLTAQASHLVATKQKNKNVEYIINSIDLSSALVIPILFGLVAIAAQLIPWYTGKEFLDCIRVMHILPFVLIFSGITSILRTQYFIPMNQDNKYVATIFAGTVINVVLNALLIPRFSFVGVAIATVTSEFIITVISIAMVQRSEQIMKAFRYFLLYIFDGIVMMIVVMAVGQYLGAGWKTNIVQVLVGGIIYLTILFGVQGKFAKEDPICVTRVICNMLRRK